MRRPGPITSTSLLFWLVFVATRVGLVVRSGGVRPQADDLARLAQVDALVAGQGWWDLTMYRLGTSGVPMHWTRHVDALFLALGGGTSVGRPFALVALPFLLALAVFLLVGHLAHRLGGRRAVPGALLLLLASVLAATQFSAAKIDHHGLQIVLVAVAVLGVLRFEESNWALIAGLALGLSLSVGLEQALVAVGVVAAVGLIVLAEGSGTASVDRFALALLASGVVGTMLFAPPNRLTSVACDVFSGFHLVAIAGAGVGLMAAARVRRRVVALIGTWGLSGVLALVIAPRCIDPYADVAPLLREYWLPNVSEAQSLLAALSSRPEFGYAVLVPAVIASAFALWRWASTGWGSSVWGRMALILVFGFAGSVAQLRAASTATVLGAVVLGVLFADLFERLASWAMPLRVVTMTVVALIISGLGPLVALTPPAEEAPSAGGASASCVDGLAASDLAGLVLAPIDLGPALLAFTDAQVLAGPYHRNNDGNLLAWELLSAPAAEVDFSGFDWVIACRGMPETSVLVASFGPGLLSGLEEGNVPDSLERVETDAEGLLLYRVRG